MLSSTEIFAITPLLSAVLWIEAIIYLSIGTYEIFDDFIAKPPLWARTADGYNAWIRLQHVVGRKMHAGICFLLGFIALNGVLAGHVTRLELELIFVSFAVIMPVIWAMTMPGRLGILLILCKPEFWLQILMFVFFSHLVRPEILVMCVVFNLWGILVNWRLVRRQFIQPFTYEALRKDIVDAAGAEQAAKVDKLAGYDLS